MDELTKQLRKLENDIVRYIYIKYFQIDPILSTEATEATEAITNELPDLANKNDSNDDSNKESEDSDLEDESKTIEQSKVIVDDKIQKQVIHKKQKTKSTRKIFDKEHYKAFKKNIFAQTRSCAVLNQYDIIKDDLRTMEIADKAYERNPKEFKISNFDIPPDVLRCSFIRKHHHRLYRCKNRISNDDSDLCKKHEECENVYYDKYNELLEQLGY